MFTNCIAMIQTHRLSESLIHIQFSLERLRDQGAVEGDIVHPYSRDFMAPTNCMQHHAYDHMYLFMMCSSGVYISEAYFSV